MVDELKANQAILAFDYGTSRVGVALSVAGETSAEPLLTLERDTMDTKLAEIFNQYRPDVVIVGRPRNLAAESTEQTRLCEEFGRKIEQEYRQKVVFVDEALSSQRARQYLAKSDRKTQKRLLDQYAAKVILEDYLHEL